MTTLSQAPLQRGEESNKTAPKPPKAAVATWIVPLIFILITMFGVWWIDIRPTAVVAGFSDISRLLARMLPAEVGPIGVLATLIGETLLIAIAGTGAAALASIPLAAVASRHYTGSRLIQSGARLLIVITRAIPTLVFAIIFVRIFGLGPFAGALAVAVHSIGMIAKMMTDTFEELSVRPREAIAATGANRLQTFISTTFTQALPQISSFVLYRLDINIRASAILGLVGAGGIGAALQTAIGSLNYPRAAGIIAVIIVLLLLLEFISYGVQKALVEHSVDSTKAQLYPHGKVAISPGWSVSRVGKVLALSITVLIFCAALFRVHPAWDRLPDAWSNTIVMLSGFIPPTFDLDIAYGLLESLVMAISATTFGVIIGLAIALLSTPHLFHIPVLSGILRALIVIIRGIPEIVYALIFVAALGLGPFPGFLALTISCTALGAKFFTDALNNIDPTPVRALREIGANQVQAFIGGAWPQFVPSFIGNSLFTSDLALRESAVLGIVGAGGIGFLMQESVATLNYQTTAGILIGLTILVVALEQLARWARKKII